MNGKTLQGMGEFEAIERMVARLSTALPDGWVGIGDDTAVMPSPDGGSILLTIDTMVAGVDFWPDTPADYPGFKIITASVSDIAAMGGTPTAAVVSIVCPRSTKQEWLEALYDGIAEAAKRFEVPVVGGDTSVGTKTVITVAMTGACAPPAPILRSGARAGDIVCVTGSLGGATGGLRIIGIERTLKKPEADYGQPGMRLLERHLKPEARLGAGRALAECGATAMIDISDGLVADVGHICERSGVGMTIDASAVPIDPDLEAVGDRISHDVLVTALTGGEDFELAATLPPERFDEAAARVGTTGTTLTHVGVVEGQTSADNLVRIIREGKELEISLAGWVHFRDEQNGD